MRLRDFSPLALCLLVALPSCRKTDEKFARAYAIRSLDQAVGGPTADARIGDYVLENDQIRAVIEQGGMSKLPLDVGGSLIDLDLQRSQAEFRGGRGLDQLGQIFPVANLFLARATNDKSSRITRTESGAAEVTVAGEAAPIQKVISALTLLLRRDFAGPTVDHSKFRLYTEYRMSPGERVVRIRTTVGFDVPFCPVRPDDGCNEVCDDILYDADCSCPKIPARCMAGVKTIDASPLPDRPEPMGIADIFVGDLPRPLGSKTCLQDEECDGALGETCTDITAGLGGTSRVCRGPAARDPGVFFGDMLLFGGHLSPFVPGIGYDTESDIRRLFDSGEDTLSTPLQLDAVYAVGDRLSYGYSALSGKVLVPVFGGPFSMGTTGAVSCRHDQPGCLAKTLMRAERIVSVGEGDAASAAESLARARGGALGEVTGSVRWAHSGKPVTGSEIFAITDPRDRACDEACQTRCGDVSGVSDDVLASWSLEELIRANRCRTPGGAFLDGISGVETATRTDLGTDPILDGSFRLALRPGRWLLVAQRGARSLSGLIPVKVEPDAKVRANFTLEEPATLEFSIIDETGRPSPGRILIGQCLPGAPCADDASCGEAKTCQAGACACARTQRHPLELGGSRASDGVVALEQTRSGKGTVQVPPGEYDVIFSRGPHYGIDRARMVLQSGVKSGVLGRVRKAVDRTGWTSADFHVHSEPSLDSATPLDDRITSFIAEDMDFLSSSDHDVLTRFEPLLQKTGERTRLGSQVGVEVTTQELGHFIGYPMRYEEWKEAERVPGNGAPEWREMKPAEIFASMRAAGVQDGPMVVSVPHPWSYFDAYGIDPVTLEPTESAITLFNPLVKKENFSGDFEAMELMNGKGFDYIRRPTAADVRFYSRGLDALLAARREGLIDDQKYFRDAYLLSTEATRRILHRTPAEQRAALDGVGGELACRCGSTGDCSSGKVCDPVSMSCVSPPSSGGDEPPGEALCKTLRGTVDDWFNMLNRGVRRSAVGGSDVHALYGYEPGSPRTLLRTDSTTAPYVTDREISQAVLDGKAIVTNGPMVHFQVNGAGIGDTITVEKDAKLNLALRVETGGWYDVDRIEVYRNGELIHWMSACESKRDEGQADPHDHPCVATGGPVVAFEQEIEDTPTRDAWYVVIALGLDGRSLSPVYASAALPRLGTFEITQRIYDIVPTLSGLRTPRFPSLYPTFPVAITNPIWVDVGADGWTPLAKPPSWCTPGRDAACKGSQ